ncbi:MAG: hypothetical protein JWM56_653 [Candidatus Peribacteria bacterium]|nr:hypothetical protein [Candidatus Peribacteria bacterium]
MLNYSRSFLIGCIAIMNVSFLSVAGAHSYGQSLEKAVDNYLIDIGYDAITLQPHQRVVFDFFLLEDKLPYPAVDFHHIDVELKLGSHREHQETVRTSPDTGRTLMGYSFEKPGTYTLLVEYVLQNGKTVDASFPIPVGGGWQFGIREILLIGAVILACWIPLYLFYDLLFSRKKQS